MADRFVDPAVAGERFDRLRVVIERSALAANQARIGRIEEVLVEGPSKKNPAVLAGRTRQHRLVHFTRAAPVAARLPTPTSRSPPPPRTTSPPASSSRPPTPATASGSRSPPVDATARRPARTDGIGQVRRGDGRRRRGARHRDRRGRRHAGVPRDGHRHGQADGRRPRCRRPPLPRPRRPERRDVGHRVPPGLRRGTRRRSPPAPAAARCSSPAPACISPRPSTDSSCPASWPDVRATLEAGARHRPRSTTG